MGGVCTKIPSLRTAHTTYSCKNFIEGATQSILPLLKHSRIGCQNSTPVEGVSKRRGSRRQSILPPVIPEIKISGDDVSFLPPPAIKVVFVFGGPGSGKGRIVANLRSMFGVRLVSIESLIFQYLPKKVQHSVKISTTKEMASLVRNDPSQISLEWVLRLLQHMIENDPNQIFVVDLIPNLRWLIKNEHLVKDCSEDMKAFEEKIPVSFAMHLSVKEGSLEKTLDYSHHESTPPTGATVSDEADNKRAKRRFKLHEEALSPFLNYFRDTNRLVTVDVSSGALEPIWDKVHEFFTFHELHAWRPVESVLVFAFGGLQVGALDLTDCDMQVVKLREVVSNAPDLPIEDLLDDLGHHIDLLADESHYFVIDPSGTKLMDMAVNGSTHRHALVFSDVCGAREACVNKISIQLNKLTELDDPYFKAVCSSEDETLLFPSDTPDSFCQQIALCMAEKHPSKRLTSS